MPLLNTEDDAGTAECCANPESPSWPTALLQKPLEGWQRASRLAAAFSARKPLFPLPRLAVVTVMAAPTHPPTPASPGRAERSRPHLLMLREGNIRHGLASLVVLGHLDDRARHVCKAKSRGEASFAKAGEQRGIPRRTGARSGQPPVLATGFEAGSQDAVSRRKPLPASPPPRPGSDPPSPRLSR